VANKPLCLLMTAFNIPNILLSMSDIMQRTFDDGSLKSHLKAKKSLQPPLGPTPVIFTHGACDSAF
jgi:hypothetical protein